MPIVSSTYTQDAHTQRDGTRYVKEFHTDDAGRVFEVGPYLIGKGVDMKRRLADRALEIDAAQEREILERQEREALEAKVATVLDAAIKTGTLTEEEMMKAGYTVAKVR